MGQHSIKDNFLPFGWDNWTRSSCGDVAHYLESTIVEQDILEFETRAGRPIVLDFLGSCLIVG